MLADRFVMRDRDVVFVSTRSITRFNRYIAQILPTIQSLLGPLLIVNQIDSLGN